MSEKEKAIVEKIKKAIPKMSEFDKGYFLGKVENLADEGKPWWYRSCYSTNLDGYIDVCNVLRVWLQIGSE